MAQERILWYFADPMCSWCWGFTPAIGAIKESYSDRLKIALMLGGLRPGTTERLPLSLWERGRSQSIRASESN